MTYGGYNYNYNDSYNAMNSAAGNIGGAMIWILIAGLLALIGGILVYYLFVKPDKKESNDFLGKLKEFLRFNKMLIEGLLKVFYIIAAIFVTLSSFAWFAVGFVGVLGFLAQITLGNVITRVLYESMLIKIMIWKNTTDINKKMK